MLNDAKCHWSQPFQEPNRGSCRKSIKSTRIFKRWKWIAFSAARRWLKLSEGHFHPAFIGATALQLRQCAHCRPQTKSSSRLWNWHSWQLQPWPMRLHGERREDMAIYLHPVHIILRDFQWAVIRSRTIRVVTEPLGLWLNLTTRYHTMLGELFFISFYDFFNVMSPKSYGWCDGVAAKYMGKVAVSAATTMGTLCWWDTGLKWRHSKGCLPSWRTSRGEGCKAPCDSGWAEMGHWDR